MKSLSGNEYVHLREFISREFGLYFEPTKITFLENRVIPFIQKMGYKDINQLIQGIQNDHEIRSEFIDALTTNETWFFRHPRHFDILREDILPDLLKTRKEQGKKELVAWSAGSSIGAEAYSIAITFREVIQDQTDWNIRIIGTDISRRALSKASEGVYSQNEIRLLPSTLLNKYFIPISTTEFQIKPELRKWVIFEEMNLLNQWPPNRFFDVIFCRNTMIYFKETTKVQLTERFYKVLNPQGVFFTSATETLHWSGDNEFERIFLRGEYVYRKSVAERKFVLYRFRTPSDLLKALNLIVKANLEYNLQPIPQKNPQSPKKALTIPKYLQPRVDELLGTAMIQTQSEEFTK